jgi:hypothetical protein
MIQEPDASIDRGNARSIDVQSQLDTSLCSLSIDGGSAMNAHQVFFRSFVLCSYLRQKVAYCGTVVPILWANRDNFLGAKSKFWSESPHLSQLQL